MEHQRFNYLKYIEKDLTFFRYMGMWIPTPRVKLTNTYFLHWFVVAALILIPNNIAEAVGCLKGNRNLMEWIDSLFVLIMACAATLKNLMIFNNREALATVHRWIEDSIFQPRNLEQNDLAEADLKFHRTVNNWGRTCVGAAVLFKIIPPIFHKERSFPLPAIFPFDCSGNYMHEIAYVYQCISIIGEAVILLYCEITFSALTTFIGIQCEFICQELEHLEVLETDDIQRMVEHHRRTVLFVSTSNSIFRNIYLVHFASIILAMCMSMFLLVLIENYDSRSLFLIFYQGSVFFVILLPCWFASEMQRKSEKIPRAAFCCRWFEASESVKKDLIYFIANTQKPLKFYAVEFFDISISTFIQILKTAFSYYTMLNNLNKKSKM